MTITASFALFLILECCPLVIFQNLKLIESELLKVDLFNKQNFKGYSVDLR